MRVAIPYEFGEPTDIRREGIGVYVSLLVKALLDYVPNLEIEFWTYRFNRENLKLLFKDSFENYPNRIFIYDESMGEKIYFKKRQLSYKDLLKKWIFKILYILTHTSAYKNKVKEINVKKKDWALNQIKKKIKLFSKANVVFCFFVTLKWGLLFDCPKFIQVHDLFTIALKKLFSLHWNEHDVDYSNRIVLDNLKNYAKANAVFISSSKYIAKNHSLKYIPNIQANQVAVIPFPPLIREFHETAVINKKDFMDKYHIPGKYMAFPSQNRPNKNWSVIFKALARLKKQGLTLYFVTTGHVVDLKMDEELVKDLGIKDLIIETGSLSSEELYALYKYADLVVASTVIEGMGISGQALEAMKLGVPVIHAESFGIKESLEAVGLTLQTAPLNWFDLYDDAELAIKIQDVLSNPKRHIEQQQPVLKAYLKRTWKEVAENYIKIFEQKIKEFNS